MYITFIGSVPLRSLGKYISSVLLSSVGNTYKDPFYYLKSIFTSACLLSQGLTVYSESSCLNLLSTGITSVYHHTRLAFHSWGAAFGILLLSSISPPFTFSSFLSASIYHLCFLFTYFLFFPILLRGSQDRFISFRDSGFNSQCCLKWGCVGTQAYSPYSSRGGPLKIRTLCWVVVSYRPIWTNLDPVSKTTNENLHQR